MLKHYSLLLPLKKLESLFVFDPANDDMYELDETSYRFLEQFEHVGKINRCLEKDEQDFIDYCLENGILSADYDNTAKGDMVPGLPNGSPSLRYLELQITDACNLQCGHCYMGKPSGRHLDMSTIKKLLDEFRSISGLKLIVSGGEPMLHPEFWQINDLISRYPFRSVLITNGTMSNNINRLRFHEVQLSIDGLENAHDYLRGKGSFAKTTATMNQLLKAGIDTSVGTIIHRKMVADIDKMNDWFKNCNLKNWILDVPVISGYLKKNKHIVLPYEEAGQYLEYGFGGGLYHSADGYACGSHLCTVAPDGTIAKCGFYSDRPAGTVSGGLLAGFKNITQVSINDLDCKNCSLVTECRGGCRYRAESYNQAGSCDPALCFGNNGSCNINIRR